MKVLLNRWILDYNTMLEVSIADYKILDMTSLTNLPYWINSKRLQQAAKVTISLHCTWYKMLCEPYVLMDFVYKLLTLSQALHVDQYIAHTIKLDIPHGLELPLVCQLLTLWTVHLGMCLEISMSNSRFSTATSGHFIQDMMDGARIQSTFAPSVVFLNSPYPFVKLILPSIVAHLQNIQHLKLGDMKLSQVHKLAFLTM
jgi:hypothetical protein